MSVTVDEIAVQFSANGVAQLLDAQRQVIRRNDAVTASVDATGKQAAVAARNIAGQIAGIAAAGEASVGSLKGIITQGANIAFMFGAGGAIAGAIGVTGVAIYNLFTRTQRMIEETSRKAQEELRAIAHAGNIGAAAGRFGSATLLYSGDEYAVRREGEGDRAFRARQIGIKGVREEIQKLLDVMPDLRRQSQQLGGAASDRFRDAQDAMREWLEIINLMKPQYEALIRLTNELAAKEGDAAARFLRDNAEPGFVDGGASRLDAITRDVRIPGVTTIDQSLVSASADTMAKQLLATVQAGLRRIPPITDDMAELLKLERVASSIGEQFGNAVINGIAAGMAAGFASGNWGEAFQTMTGAILVGLGQMAISIGTQSLAFLGFMQTIKDAIMSFMPGLGLPAALGMIALGTLMVGLGSSMGRGRIGGGSGSTVYTQGPTVYTGTVSPLTPSVAPTSALSPIQPVTVHATFFGKNDPTAQRELLEMIAQARRRGGVNG